MIFLGGVIEYRKNLGPIDPHRPRGADDIDQEERGLFLACEFMGRPF